MNSYLTIDEIVGALAHFMYEPGWGFSICLHEYDKTCIGVYPPFCDGKMRVPVPPLVNVEHFNDWLHWRLDQLENQEFWLADGKLVCDYEKVEA